MTASSRSAVPGSRTEASRVTPACLGEGLRRTCENAAGKLLDGTQDYPKTGDRAGRSQGTDRDADRRLATPETEASMGDHACRGGGLLQETRGASSKAREKLCPRRL